MFYGMAQHRASGDPAAQAEYEHVFGFRPRQEGQMTDQRLRAQVQARGGIRLAVDAQADVIGHRYAVATFDAHRRIRGVFVKLDFDMLFAERHRAPFDLDFLRAERAGTDDVAPAFAAQDE